MEASKAFVFLRLTEFSCCFSVDVSSCRAGALVGSVTNQISTFHLTRDVESAPASPSSPVLSSPSQAKDRLSGQTQLSG